MIQPKQVALNPYLAESTWFISFLTGNDKSAGNVIGAPLKTYAELVRRWGTKSPQLTAGTVTITIIDHNASDPIDFQNQNQYTGAVIFQGATPAILQSGSYTAVRPSVLATNTPPGLADSAIPGGVWPIGRRVKVTSGVATGAYYWINKDEGAFVSRVTNATVDGTTKLQPGVGDTYQIETLVNVFIRSLANKGAPFFATPNIGYVILRDLNCKSGGLGTVGGLFLSGERLIRFERCQVDLSFQAFHAAVVSLVNSHFGVNSGQSFIRSTVSLTNGGGIGAGSQALLATQGTNLEFNGWIGQNKAAILYSGSLGSGEYGSFDCVANSFNPTGDGLIVGAGAFIAPIGPGYWNTGQGQGQAWGAGHAGFGIRIGPSSTFVYFDTTNAPTIVGALGDYTTVANGTNSAFGYNAVTLVAEGPFPNTYVNLATASPGGFGRSAHDPRTNAHIIMSSKNQI